MTAWLVTIEGLRGPEAQIWHGAPGKFIGPPLQTIACVALPDDREWPSIDAALDYVRSHPDLISTGEANG